MEVSIFNVNNSKIKDNIEALLLWSSFLISETIHFGGTLSVYMTYESFYKRLSEERRIKFFKISIPKIVKEENAEKIDAFYQSFYKLCKKKHKSPKDLIAINKGKKVINVYYTVWKDWVLKVLKATNLLELVSYAEEDKKILCWILPISQRSEKLNEEFFTFVNGALYFPEIMHFHYSESVIEESILSTKLFEMPVPVSLSTNQVKIIRNDLLDKFKPFFERIVEFNSSLKEIEYNKKNLKKLKKEYFDKACEEKNSLQDAIDNNLYMNQLKNKLEEDKTLSIYLGLASFNNILEFYKRALIIDDYIIMYVKDKMKEELNMNGSKFFLYLKTT